MIVMPSTYSPATIAREFKVIHEFELSSMKYGVIFDKNVPKAAIIRMNTESLMVYRVTGLSRLLIWLRSKS